MKFSFFTCLINLVKTTESNIENPIDLDNLDLYELNRLLEKEREKLINQLLFYTHILEKNIKATIKKGLRIEAAEKKIKNERQESESSSSKKRKIN